MKQNSKRRKNLGDINKDTRASLSSQRGVMGGESQSAQAPRRPPLSIPQNAMRVAREQQLEEVKEELRGEQQLTDRPDIHQ